MKPVILLVATLGLSACGSAELFESVSVRMGDMTCTERYQINNNNEIGVTAGTRGEENFGSVSLTLPATGGGGKPEQRCQEALDIAEERARIKLASERIELEIAEARKVAELRDIEQQDQDLSSDW